LDFAAETEEHTGFHQPKWDIRWDIKWACRHQQMITLVLLNSWINLVFSSLTIGGIIIEFVSAALSRFLVSTLVVDDDIPIEQYFAGGVKPPKHPHTSCIV